MDQHQIWENCDFNRNLGDNYGFLHQFCSDGVNNKVGDNHSDGNVTSNGKVESCSSGDI